MLLTNASDQFSIRERNRSAVLRFICHEASLSRSQLAGRTGLNKSTVPSLVENLLDRRLIVETGLNSVGKRRPATLLEINPQAGGVVSVGLGVDFVSMAGAFLVPSIRESVDKHAMQEILAQAEIKLSAFGRDASLVGAAAVVVDDVLTYSSHVEKEVMPHTLPAPIVEYR